MASLIYSNTGGVTVLVLVKLPDVSGPGLVEAGRYTNPTSFTIVRLSLEESQVVGVSLMLRPVLHSAPGW